MRLVIYLSALVGITLAEQVAIDAHTLEVTHNGRGTVYTQDGATGSCGHANGDNTLIAAIGNYWMKHQSPSPYCGRRIQAKNTGSNDGVGGKGNTITVIVQDTCYSCGENDIDFSVAAWNKLTNGAPFGNFDAQWHFI